MPVAKKTKREPRTKVKNDPKFVAAARELRDRWLEKVADDPSLIGSAAKYEVSRALPDRPAESVTPTRLLPQAA